MNASPSTTPVHSPAASNAHSLPDEPAVSHTPRTSPPSPDLIPTQQSEPDPVDVDVDMTDPDDVKPHEDIVVDVPLDDVSGPAATAQTPENNNNNQDASPSDTSVATRPPPDDDDADKPPPAKRARRLSDPDQASLVHSNGANGAPMNGLAHPPSPSAVPGPSSSPLPSTFSQQQYKFCLSTVRQLKKSKDAVPFLSPVDPVALRIPHYLNIIKHPMDLSTVEKKSLSSNPNKPDPNLANPRYHSSDEFVHDVKLIFSNTVTFNGPDHVISQMAKRLESQFDKSIKHMPPPAEPLKPVAKKEPTPPPPPPPPPPPVVVAPPPPKKAPTRRSSASVPTIRRSETEASGRPKREIHPPPPKDLPYADAPRKTRKDKKKDDGTAEQLKFCGRILSDFAKKKLYWASAAPFMEPVDWRSLNLPSYPKVIKKPMDLRTMREKLDRGEYANANRFWDDFKLMIKNCFTFNPPSAPVHKAGEQLQAWFDEKWKQLPPLREVSDDDDDTDDDSDSEQAMTIAMMENQLATLKSGIDAIKKKKPTKKDKPTKRDKYAVSASAPTKNGKLPTTQKSGKKKIKMLPDEEVLSFEQKKDLSETIQTLEGGKLERVIQIIHEGVPEIRDSTEEIELDIDSLPASVLTKLYNFVLRPLRPSKRRSNNPGGGTGGLKRKSMDEDFEAEKIRRLEAQLHRFDASNGAVSAYTREDESQSSDSSDESGSSGSDSD